MYSINSKQSESENENVLMCREEPTYLLTHSLSGYCDSTHKYTTYTTHTNIQTYKKEKKCIMWALYLSQDNYHKFDSELQRATLTLAKPKHNCSRERLIHIIHLEDFHIQAFDDKIHQVTVRFG